MELAPFSESNPMNMHVSLLVIQIYGRKASICKYLAPVFQFLSSKVFLFKSKVYDQEQQFIVFTWLNKNFHEIQEFPLK